MGAVAPETNKKTKLVRRGFRLIFPDQLGVTNQTLPAVF